MTEDNLSWPLMRNNIAREDLDAVIELLRSDDPILTQSRNVAAFENEWSAWLGVRHSVFVNSGASANLITMAALRETRGLGEVIVPTLTWVSDIASVMQNGFTPVFVDIDPRTLGMNTAEVLRKVTVDTRAVFLTHILGYNALDRLLLDGLAARGIPLIEDVCESHGATFEGRKLGNYGVMSNFSFYYAHHMTTVEGGMVCTNDEELYEILRMLRAHGMVREARSPELKRRYQHQYSDLNPEFIFAYPAYNVRSTELNAVLGRSQLKRLDERNALRIRNLQIFLSGLDPALYRTDFALEGSCNYAFTLVLRMPDPVIRDRLMQMLKRYGVEFRRGTSGGGNQLRQPFIRNRLGEQPLADYPEVDHVHFFGFYIGNYPELEPAKILQLCELLNRVAAE
jgi:CDP-6-deoxy-D-xylo-4-hexulose-3-dehydrase